MKEKRMVGTLIIDLAFEGSLAEFTRLEHSEYKRGSELWKYASWHFNIPLSLSSLVLRMT